MSTENDDSDNVREPEAEAPPPPRRRPMLPGPGLGESLLWIVGYMAIQVGFGVVIQNVVGMWTGGDAEALVEKLGQNGVITVMLLPTMLSLLILIPAGIWRLTPEPFRKLNLSPPSLTQLTILLATTAALSLFGSSIQAVVQSHLFPWLEKNNPEVIEDLKRLDFQQLLGGLRNASFPVLLFYLAVVPAVGEELLFRGIIGRGLTARWGIVTGVLLTSMLFAGVHLYPPQVIGLLPLAIFLHISYLATRSFWAPMLVHFVNNALAAVMLHFGPVVDDPLAVVPLTVPDFIVMVLSGLFGALGAIAMWSVKTEYVTPDGEEAVPSYPTVERPPSQLGLRRSAPTNVALILVFTLLLAVESFVFWRSLDVELPAEPAEATLMEFTPLSRLHT